MLNSMYLIFAIVFVDRGKTHGEQTFHQSVVENTSLTINCSSSTKTSSMHVWWFNDTVMFAQRLEPAELGIHNVKGTLVDSSLSYLHFDRFLVPNSGKYKCTKGGNDIVTYILDILETTDSPTLVTQSVMENTTITINCSSSSNSSMRHVWWFNGKIIFANSFQPSEIGIYNVKGGYVDSTLSFLHFDRFSLHNTGNYTCDDGHAVKILYMLDINDNSVEFVDSHEKEDKQDNNQMEFIFSNPVFISIGGSIILLASLCCIFVICKKVKTAGLCTRHRSRALQSTSPQMMENKDIVIERNPSCEYEDAGTTNFSRSDVCLHNMLSSSPGVLRFVGSLRNCNINVTNVLVSRIADKDNASQARMWKNYVNALLLFTGHSNLLETIGLCRESDNIFVIQYYLETTLKLHLLSLFHRSKETTALAQRSYSQLACDVINGIEFLSSNDCVHPGLSTEKVLVNSMYSCKLYDFCMQEDVRTFTDINFPKSGRLSIIGLAPEFVFSGEYTSASDVWSLGIILWEIYCAGEGTVEERDVKFIENFRSGIVTLPKPKHCSQMLFDVLETCWSANSKDRLDISDFRLKLRYSLSMMEESQDISPKVADRGICKDVLYDEPNTPCTRHIYQVLGSTAESDNTSC